MKSLENYTAEQLELEFGIREAKHLPRLDAWLASKCVPTKTERDHLMQLQALLQDSVDAWNEDEVKFFFIGPLVVLIDFNGQNYKPFTQRGLHATLLNVEGGTTEIGGKVDLMVATGKETPRQPFFFIHEYKQERRRDTDPKGQLLAAMLVAQQRNGEDFPVLGSYVIGRLWFFLVLEGSTYAHSLAFDATREALFDVFSILRGARSQVAEVAQKFIPSTPERKVKKAK